MESLNHNINPSTDPDARIVSAKIPGWLFNAIEELREKCKYGTRNATQSVLIATGLREYGLLSTDECKAFIETQEMTDNRLVFGQRGMNGVHHN